MTPADTLLRTWLRATADRWERAADADPPDFAALADMPRRPGDVTIAEIVEAARRLAEVEAEDEPDDYERVWVPFDSLGADGGWTRMANPTADIGDPVLAMRDGREERAVIEAFTDGGAEVRFDSDGRGRWADQWTVLAASYTVADEDDGAP